MAKAKVYIISGLAILLAVLTSVYYVFDGDDNTNPDINGTIKTVTDNVQKIKDARNIEYE